MNPDLGNALFEAVGAVLTWKNAAALRRDQEIKGVYWPATVFFMSWGLWNAYYYAAIGQWLSWGAGLILVAGNIQWVWMAVGLALKKRREARAA